MSMLAPEQTAPLATAPVPRADAAFAAGKGTPRDFLEGCLSNWPTVRTKVGAFVDFDIAAARAAADAVDRALARRQAGFADRRHADGHQGHHQHRRHANRDGLAAVRRLALGEGRSLRVRAAASRRGDPRQDCDHRFAATEPRGTRNPWNLEHTPGGSSSGSAAAVGCGMVSAALGTQVIGSTIRPASFCGAYGFKPTVNALNREGCHDYQSQSCTGIIAATLEDTWQVAYEIVDARRRRRRHAGPHRPAARPAPAKPKRLAFLETAGWRERRARGADDHAGGLAAAEGRRHRDRHAPRRREDRSGRKRHRRRASAVEQDQ